MITLQYKEYTEVQYTCIHMTNICMRVYCTSGLPPAKETKPSNDDDDNDDYDNDNLFFYNI